MRNSEVFLFVGKSNFQKDNEEFAFSAEYLMVVLIFLRNANWLPQFPANCLLVADTHSLGTDFPFSILLFAILHFVKTFFFSKHFGAELCYVLRLFAGTVEILNVSLSPYSSQ